MGNGNGTFDQAEQFYCGMGAWAIISGDFDNDGSTDLAAANHVSDIMSVLLGDGDGAFSSAVQFYSGMGPRGITSGDLDVDGNVDLVIVNQTSNNLSVFINLTQDLTATLLSAYSCASRGESVEISWQLSEAGQSMEFSVYREDESGRSVLLNAGITESGDWSYRVIDKEAEPGSTYHYRVDVTDESGTRTLFVTEAVTAELPMLSLDQNYPNPFNPSTSVWYSIPERTHVTLDILDVSGRRIVRLEDSVKGAGTHESRWSGRNQGGDIVSSGLYFYRLTAGKKSITRKMILMR
jgi:hypothetical protein